MRLRYQLAFQGHNVSGLPARGRAVFEGGEVFQHLRHQPAPGLATRCSVCVYRVALPAPADHPAGATSSLPETSAFQATTPFAALLAAVHLSVLATEVGLWWADSVQLLAMGDSGGLLVACCVRRSPAHLKSTAAMFFSWDSGGPIRSCCTQG
jgi:hypothetical protein